MGGTHPDGDDDVRYSQPDEDVQRAVGGVRDEVPRHLPVGADVPNEDAAGERHGGPVGVEPPHSLVERDGSWDSLVYEGPELLALYPAAIGRREVDGDILWVRGHR